MEILLVRFNTEERQFIRKASKREKTSEAEVVRDSIRLMMRYKSSLARSKANQIA